LLKTVAKSGIKIIDFGSSCFDNERIYTYIQSRFYRAPEIILGIPYNVEIDMWSLGCILVELYTGIPIFPGESEAEQMTCMMEVKGIPPTSLLERGTRANLFFDQNPDGIFIPKKVTNSRGKTRIPATKPLNLAIKCNDPIFLDFLNKCLEWDPYKRIKPDEAMKHAWLSDCF
jgi:dual specificity tyrosine-phosphorylation-regulated kinase 2/3/4